ncbi:uncharacterized protein KZ484_009883 [Pholidichthys leucotaenia]
MLRGIITEKLSAAAREILAVVERTVADYEEEASGFRREIDRQRRQLELLQPEIKLERIETGVDIESLRRLWFHTGGDGEEEQQQLVQPSMSPRQNPEALKDPDDEVRSSLSLNWRKPHKPQASDIPTHLYLQFCFLSDSQTTVTSLKASNNPVKILKCPHGLQETDFLALLKSTFPELGPDKPFDIFVSDSSQRLHTLNVKSLTPEEICRAAGDSVLYIHLKAGEKAELHPLPVTESSEAEICSRSEYPEDVAGPSSPQQQQQDLQPEDDTANDKMDSSRSEDGEEVLDGDDDWKPHPQKCEMNSCDDEDGDEALDADDFKTNSKPRPQKTMRQQQGSMSDLVGISQSKLLCKVCNVCYIRKGSLIKHAWSHVDETPNVCGVCGERFESVEELKEHFRNSHKLCECSVCGKSLSNVISYNTHMSTHAGNKPFKCDICDKTFPYYSSLRTHRSNHKKEKPYKCDICQKSFGVKGMLTAHIKVHTDRYVCNICGKILSHLRSLRRHKATHSDIKPHSCQVCGKSFRLLDLLRTHEKIHMMRERPHLCHICSKSFMKRSTLVSHLKTHSGEKQFVCNICNKHFQFKGNLKAHMQVHADDRPYCCSECGRSFKYNTHLKNHLRIHSGIKEFLCHVCGKACAQADHLPVHIRTHNRGNRTSVPFMTKAFTLSQSLKTHLTIRQAEEEKPSLSPSMS